MGIYCNPEIGKFEWLEKNAISISKEQAIEFKNKRKNNDYVILCHVINTVKIPHVCRISSCSAY